MNDTRAGDILRHQLDRQRADLLEAVRVYEEDLAQAEHRAQELEAERDMERTRAAELEVENHELHAGMKRLRLASEELVAERDHFRLAHEELMAEADTLRTEQGSLLATAQHLTGSHSGRITRLLRALLHESKRLRLATIHF